MKKFNNEIKTGLVIVIALMIGFFFWARTSNFRSEVYRLKTYFSHADGIRESALVALAGIEVGRVEKVQFVYGPDQTKVELILLVDKKARVRADSIAFIGTTGFVGDAYVGLTPGNAKEYLKSGDTVMSEDPVEMRELMKRADQIAKQLDGALTDVRTLVSDNRDKVSSIVGNLEATAVNFKDFSEDIKQHPWKLLMKGKEEKRR